MKTIIEKVIFIAAMALFTSAGFGQAIQVDCNGNVGIGCSPTLKLDVNGSTNFNVGSSWGNIVIDNSGFYGSPALYPTYGWSGQLGLSYKAFDVVWSYEYSTPSDLRLKENIRDIRDPLDIVLKLRGVKYDLKKETAYNDTLVKDEKIKARLETRGKNKIGFIAQDVQKVLPEIVFYDDSTDSYGIDYSKAVPVLVEAIKVLSSKIDSLEQINKKSSLKSATVNTGIEEATVQDDKPYLEQNAPNPFSVSTSISFYIPQSYKKAAIYIYDMQGLQKKSYYITTKGLSGITVNGSELPAGMYLYSLIVDGMVIDTKQMILTD